jgi:hypothetical protein
MARILGTLLLVLSLLPRLAAEGSLVVLGSSGDGRAAVAVAGNVEHFGLTTSVGLERLLVASSGGGAGHAPTPAMLLVSLPVQGHASAFRIHPPTPALRSRRHAELLPYHANAPPKVARVG